jgi:hypothetical protein
MSTATVNLKVTEQTKPLNHFTLMLLYMSFYTQNSSHIVLSQHMQQCYYMRTPHSNVQTVINEALQTPVSRENKYSLLTGVRDGLYITL